MRLGRGEETLRAMAGRCEAAGVARLERRLLESLTSWLACTAGRRGEGRRERRPAFLTLSRLPWAGPAPWSLLEAESRAGEAGGSGNTRCPLSMGWS